MRHDGTSTLQSIASGEAEPFGRYPDLPSFIYGITREIWEDRGVGAKLKRYYADDVIVRAPTGVIVCPADRTRKSVGAELWWDLGITETSQQEPVRAARRRFEAGRAAQTVHV